VTFEKQFIVGEDFRCTFLPAAIRGPEETLLAAVCAGCVVLLALDTAVQNIPGGEHRSPDIEQPFPFV
jgi:hypothetical protein